jgi:hypothetical protein
LKNRKLLYILIPATVLIWGAIVFTIIDHMDASDQIAGEDYIRIRIRIFMNYWQTIVIHLSQDLHRKKVLAIQAVHVEAIFKIRLFSSDLFTGPISNTME